MLEKILLWKEAFFIGCFSFQDFSKHIPKIIEYIFSQYHRFQLRLPGYVDTLLHVKTKRLQEFRNTSACFSFFETFSNLFSSIFSVSLHRTAMTFKPWKFNENQYFRSSTIMLLNRGSDGSEQRNIQYGFRIALYWDRLESLILEVCALVNNVYCRSTSILVVQYCISKYVGFVLRCDCTDRLFVFS